MTWQPIETVAKDGTKIDLWTETGRVTDCYFKDDVWWLDSVTEGGPFPLNVFGGEPTHWMPLPAPPA